MRTRVVAGRTGDKNRRPSPLLEVPVLQKEMNWIVKETYLSVRSLVIMRTKTRTKTKITIPSRLK